MKRFILLCCCIFVAVALYGSLFTVGEQENIIITRFGKPMRTITKAGIHFKLPGFFETVNRFDKRIEMFETRPTQMLLKDKNPIIISCFVAWNINDPLLFFQSLGDEQNGELKLNDMVNSRLSIVLADYTDENIINTDSSRIRLKQIQNQVMEYTNENAMNKYGVCVVDVGIQRLAYPATVVKAVYDRMKSERKKEADKITAEGKEQANKIMIQADKEARGIKAAAEKKALITKGQGDEKAMEIYARAYGEDEQFFDFIKSLETYSNVLKSDTTLILSTDSELFKYLQMQKGDEK